MFLVKDDSCSREERILKMVETDPAIAVILAAVHFEWTFRRVLIGIGKAPNKVIREKLVKAHGLRTYKDLWKGEVKGAIGKSLVQVVKEWKKLTDAFDLRDHLVHGIESCSKKYAEPKVKAAIEASRDLRFFASSNGLDVDRRLPVRKKSVIGK